MSEVVEKVIRIRIDSSGAQQGARQVNTALNSIGKSSANLKSANDNHADSLAKLTGSMNKTSKAGSTMAGILDNIKGKTASTIPLVGDLVLSLGRIGPQAAAIGAVAIAIGAIAVASINAARQTQLWKANLLTVTDSSTEAKAAYAGLVNFARSTPFTMEQSIQGFTKLRALGLSTSVEIMTAYGNTAAAMGKDMSQMIEAVADATTGEFERLKEFGIKAKQSGDSVAFTFQGVTTTVGKNAAEIEKYLVGIGKTEFGGAMARQMDTIQGSFANLSDSIFLMFARMGEGELGKLIGNIANTIADGVSAVTPLLGGIMDLFAGIGRVVWEVIKTVGSLFSVGFGGAEGATSLIQGLSVAFTYVGQTVSVVAQLVGGSLRFIAEVAGLVVNTIRQWFGKLFGWMIPSFDFAGQSAGEALVGILRAAQFVASQLPVIFSAALADLKSMFSSVGSALAASLTGDFSKWASVDLDFSSTGKALVQTWAGAKSTFNDRAANRQWIDDAAGIVGAGDISFDAVRGTPSASGSGDKAADEAKKRLADEKEFWKTLQDEAATAALLPIAAENHRKELELQKILGRDLVASEQERIAAATQLIRTNRFLSDALATSQDNQRKAAIEEELIKKRMAGLTDDQLDQERAVLEFRSNAAKQGLDLQSEAYRASEAQLRNDLARLDAAEQINRQLTQGVSLAEKYSGTFQRQKNERDYATDLAAVRATYLGGGFGEGDAAKKIYDETVEGLNRASREAAATMYVEFGQRITDLGDMIGGKWGRAIGKVGQMIESLAAAAKGDFGGMGVFGGIADVFGRKLDGSLNSFGQAFQQGTQGIQTSLSTMFSSRGEFVKGLGGLLGQAGMGSQIGSAVAGVGKAIWGKFSTTGSQVGGAIGSFLPIPGGEIIGSILGGIVGGLFKKTKQGYATVTADGMTTGGNNKDMIAAASTIGDSVTASLTRIAEQFGGSVGGFGSITVGQRDGDWRVNSGGTSLKTKKGATDFGDDAEAAARYVISLAIERGAIQGLRAGTSRLLRAGKDLEAQIDKALAFENVFKTLDAIENPVKSAIDTLDLEFKNLRKIFQEAGATTAEYADLEKLRSVKMADLLKQETSTLRDIMDTLNGAAGGMSPLALLTHDLGELATFQADVAAGKQINQADYSALVDDILGNAQSLYGLNSTQYQAIIGQLRDTTGGALTNVESAFSSNGADATTNAVNAQTNALLASQATANDYLAQIAAALPGAVGGNIYQQMLARRAAVNGELQ